MGEYAKKKWHCGGEELEMEVKMEVEVIRKMDKEEVKQVEEVENMEMAKVDLKHDKLVLTWKRMSISQSRRLR